MEILNHLDNWLQLEFLHDIQKSMSIPLYDMQSLCLCVTLCHQHPEGIYMELPMCQDTFKYADIYSTTEYTIWVAD